MSVVRISSPWLVGVVLFLVIATVVAGAGAAGQSRNGQRRNQRNEDGLMGLKSSNGGGHNRRVHRLRNNKNGMNETSIWPTSLYINK